MAGFPMTGSALNPTLFDEVRDQVCDEVGSDFGFRISDLPASLPLDVAAAKE